MANLNTSFEGNVENISQRQLDYISEILEEHGFKNENVLIEPVGEVGDNYVATVKRITVVKNGQKFKMIAKIAPESETLRKTMNTDILFRNENLMYTEVLPQFTELEILYGIPEQDKLRYPVCYGSYSKKPNEVILLEDMKELGYIMFDKFKSLTNDVVKIVLKDFAKLHSLSFLLKNQEPETYDTFKSKLISFWSGVTKSQEVIKHFTKLENYIIQILDDEKHKSLVVGSLSRINNVVKNLRNDDEGKNAVIHQGDCWTNNLLFEMNGEHPVSCCIIDYQVSNESSPAADILYMVLNCTDLETRSKHYKDWIDYYYCELDKCLAKFKLQTTSIYPRSQLDSDLKRFGKMSFCVSLILANVLMQDSADAQKLKNQMSQKESKNNDNLINSTRSVDSYSRLKTKLEELIEGCIQLEIL